MPVIKLFIYASDPIRYSVPRQIVVFTGEQSLMPHNAAVNNDANILMRQRMSRRVLSCSTSFIHQLIACKPVAESEGEIQSRRTLKSILTRLELTGIGLGGIIGAGIFVLSGHAAAVYSGPSVIIAFVIAGIVALLAALSFGEIASMMPLSGAAYTYTYATLGEYLAWFIGWNYALLYQLAASTVVIDWSKYVVHLVYLMTNYNATTSIVQAPLDWNMTTESVFVTGGAINLPAIAITIAITVLLVVGIRPTAIVNLVLVIFKIIILLIFIFATCKYVNRDNYKPFVPPNQGTFTKYGTSGLLKSCTYVFFAYVGFDSIATVAEEAKERRFIPYATVASVVISFIIYVGISTVMVGLYPYWLLDTESPLSTAISATPYGLWLLILMNLGAIAGLTTVALTMLLSQTRIFFAMARDGLLPSFFADVPTRTGTPLISTIISGTFCAITSSILPVKIIGDITSISALVTYLFVHIEVIIMYYRHPYVGGGGILPWGPWVIPPLGAILCIVLMAGIEKNTGYGYLVWTGLGQIVYFSYGYWHSHQRRRQQSKSLNSSLELLPTATTPATIHALVVPVPNLNSETTESEYMKVFRL